VASAEEIESLMATGEPSSAALATRYLPATHARGDLGSLAFEASAHWTPLSQTAHASSLLSNMLEIRLRSLAGPQPADPRRRLTSGSIALRLPLGNSFDLCPGVRMDYARHPVEELWTSGIASIQPR
jgi:hypothetical protein